MLAFYDIARNSSLKLMSMLSPRQAFQMLFWQACICTRLQLIFDISEFPPRMKVLPKQTLNLIVSCPVQDIEQHDPF
jgi:hypothetical protein